MLRFKAFLQEAIDHGSSFLSRFSKPAPPTSSGGFSSARQRWIPAIRTANGLVIGKRGQAHADIRADHGDIKGEAGYYDPLTKSFTSRSEVDVDSTDLMTGVQRMRQYGA